MFERFLPRLRARESERDGALAEARTGFFFQRNGFRIVAWAPEAVLDRPGDMEVQWQDTEPVFVEVKGPGWEGELSAEEIRAGRRFLPKYINAEGRAVGPVARVVSAVDKALPKFAPDRINLVVVVDDLFVSPHLKFDVRGQRCLVYKKIKHLEELLAAELKGLEHDA